MIAREGWAPLGGALTAAWLVNYFYGTVWALPLWSLLPILLFLYRYPKRDVPALPLAVVSPADGRITEIKPIRDPWLEREVLCIGIQMRAPGVSPLRSPIEGKVMEFWTRAGSCLTPFQSQSAVDSFSCYALWVKTDEGDDIVMAVSGRPVVSRFKSDIAPGERVGQGQRNGFVYFGTCVHVLVPASALARVKAGQRTLAGCGIIASLVHL